MPLLPWLLSHLRGSNTLAEEKRQLLNRITTLEEDLEEEQLNNDTAQEKAKKALQQVWFPW